MTEPPDPGSARGRHAEEIGEADALAAAGAAKPGARRGRRLLAAVRPTKPIREMTPGERRVFAENVGDLMAARRRVSLQYPRNWDELTEDQKLAVTQGMADTLREGLRRADGAAGGRRSERSGG